MSLSYLPLFFFKIFFLSITYQLFKIIVEVIYPACSIFSSAQCEVCIYWVFLRIWFSSAIGMDTHLYLYLIGSALWCPLLGKISPLQEAIISWNVNSLTVRQNVVYPSCPLTLILSDTERNVSLQLLLNTCTFNAGN